jgi:hypothetical protein
VVLGFEQHGLRARARPPHLAQIQTDGLVSCVMPRPPGAIELVPLVVVSVCENPGVRIPRQPRVSA